jgi:hypothetical protein
LSIPLQAGLAAAIVGGVVLAREEQRPDYDKS